MAGLSLFDKVWNAAVVTELDDGVALLHVNRHLLHDMNAMKVLVEIRQRGYRVRNPELTLATPDHGLSTLPGRTDDSNPAATKLLKGMREEAALAGVRCYDINEDGQGIVHIIGPELGLTQPGLSIVCGDSHTCTQGGLGALAFGVGRSEVIHVLATQTLYQKKPKRMRIRFEGTPAPGVAPKDLVLHLIGEIGAAGGSGYAVEFAGEAIRAMSIEGRLTICNLAIEFGAKFGLVAPDETTFAYLKDKPLAPKGVAWDAAVTYWKTLPSDPDAHFDREITIDAAKVQPQVTWGTSPQQVTGIDGVAPDPATIADPEQRKAVEDALAYMGLLPNQKLAGTPIDWAFIGSCTNGRIEDLRAAADVARGRKVAAGVRAWVVPGSQKVRRAAEAEGLDKVFVAAGFEWRAPGCSMCLAANGETVPPKARSVSTTNRNFEGRQGPEARTHLASPAMAAAAAIAGCITDFRTLGAPNHG
jgi:3-isopropylmalate/(R)-2-methylmalate dehydratase large subunit